MIEGNTIADMETEDFGFNNDYETAMEMGDILVLSDYHILPNAGGWNDQTVADKEDIFTYLRGLAWARNLKGNRDDEGNSTATEGETETEGIIKTGNWQSLI